MRVVDRDASTVCWGLWTRTGSRDSRRISTEVHHEEYYDRLVIGPGVARSTYVYVVLNGVPVAGFTVKHELVSWIRGNIELHDTCKIWRLPDAPYPPSYETRHPTDITDQIMEAVDGTDGAR